ncbi:hypothetical protein D3C85_1496450 [compost metagenome]
MLARIEPHATQGFILFEHPHRRIAKCIFIPRHREHAVVAMANVLRRRSLIVSHHAEPGSQCLKHHVAEGFRQAREQKHIP